MCLATHQPYATKNRSRSTHQFFPHFIAKPPKVTRMNNKFSVFGVDDMDTDNKKTVFAMKYLVWMIKSEELKIFFFRFRGVCFNLFYQVMNTVGFWVNKFVGMPHFLIECWSNFDCSLELHKLFGELYGFDVFFGGWTLWNFNVWPDLWDLGAWESHAICGIM